MIPDYVGPIDWRSQLDELSVLLDRRGGVAHVYAGANAPGSAFARTLRTILTGRAFTSVQIDPSNANTHHLRDALEQIALTCGVPFPGVPTAAPLAIDVGSGIRSRGPVTVRNVDVDIHLDASVHESDGTIARRLAMELGARVATAPVALIFFDSHEHSRQLLRSFRRDLWDGAFSHLVPSGLVLVDISDPQQLIERDGSWPPPPDVAVALPDIFDAESRAAAAADLAGLALTNRFCETESEADTFADTLLRASDNVRDLHARLARYLVSQLTGRRD